MIPLRFILPLLLSGSFALSFAQHFSVTGRMSGFNQETFGNLSFNFTINSRHQISVEHYGYRNSKPFGLDEGNLEGQELGLNYRHYLKSIDQSGFYGGLGWRSGNIEWSGRTRTLVSGRPETAGEVFVIILTAGIINPNTSPPVYEVQDFADEFTLSTLEAEVGYRFRLTSFMFVDLGAVVWNQQRGAIAPEVRHLVKERLSGTDVGGSVGTSIVF